jgi:NADH-quinone oxidoreductase subunit L
MYDLLWLIPTLPLAGFLALAGFGRSLGRAVPWVGAGSVGAAAAIALMLGVGFFGSPPEGGSYLLNLGGWIVSGDLRADFGLYLDALSMLMVLVITGVGFLIHLYSAEYMADDADRARFFACMNLFVAAMLMLVLGSNLLVLFLGWEGVGLASFLLIGFWYDKAENAQAAIKAFTVTRIGDAGMALGLLVLFTQVRTLDIQAAVAAATSQWGAGSALATLVALLLLCGAVGKSGQVPLQVWLPDAMAGPTPVSALIHAATMVTAGVYLVARLHGLFALSETAMAVVRWGGIATLLLGGICALFQRDIKRALAYSTVSQIGYMFLALGVGAWSAAMFHFMTHAFFKALLFLAAGWIIVALHHEQDMFRMGGLKAKMPVAFWSFVIGGASLAAVPFLGSGFFSKEQILDAVYSSPLGGPVPWALAVFGALLTSLYTARMIALVFYGKEQTHPHAQPGMAMRIPLIVLGFLALVGGLVEWPHLFADIHAFSSAMSTALPAAELGHVAGGTAWMLFLIAEAVVVGGLLYGLARWKKQRKAPAVGFAARGLGFDALYDFLLVRPYRALAGLLRNDPAENLPTGAAAATGVASHVFAGMQTGHVRRYLAYFAAGAVTLILLMTWW